MSDITNHEYWKEVESLANQLFEEGKEANPDDPSDPINDYLLHETIDGHQWVIYYAYNDDVIKHTSSEDAYLEVYGHDDIGRIVADQGIDHFRMVQAFWALYQDVSDKLYELLEDYEPEENNED